MVLVGKRRDSQVPYERWAKVVNLKAAAKTLNFLVENNVTDYGELAGRADAAGKSLIPLSDASSSLRGAWPGTHS